MRHREMTIDEFFAWKSGDLEEYHKLLTRKHWLESRISGASVRQYDAQISMSVFDDDEHYDPQYLKYKAEYDKETAKLEKYEKEWEDVSRKLIPFMTKRED